MSDSKIETHPLEPFLPANAKLLMLGSFHHLKAVGKWIFIIRIIKMLAHKMLSYCI